MSKQGLGFIGSFRNLRNKATIDVSISLVNFEEEGTEILYAPALEVYGYGNSFSEAKKSFGVCLSEFIDYTLSKGTLDDELKRMGWTIKGHKNNRKYKTPELAELLVNNERLIKIVNHKNFKTFKADIPMALHDC